jgi:hypothetical protein
MREPYLNVTLRDSEQDVDRLERVLWIPHRGQPRVLYSRITYAALRSGRGGRAASQIISRISGGSWLNFGNEGSFGSFLAAVCQ